MGPESLVFLIPIVAILGGISLGGFKEWLKFKSKQDRLGNSTHELEATVGALQAALEDSEAEREHLTERVQNLETIVTSEDWDALQDALQDAPARGALGDGQPASPAGASAREKPGGAERAERLARRMDAY